MGMTKLENAIMDIETVAYLLHLLAGVDLNDEFKTSDEFNGWLGAFLDTTDTLFKLSSDLKIAFREI